MTYFNKNKELKRGYNAYIDESTNYMGTLPTAPTSSITKPTACWLPRAPRSP